jgi:protein-disulfide isomerase
MDSSFQPQPKWYQTRVGRIFLAILSIFFVILLSFGALVGYYTWQVFRGNEVVLTSPFSSTLSQETLSAGTQEVSNAELNKTIYSHSPTRGEASAPITLVMFIDFECPYCRASFAPLEEALTQYSDAVYLVFKHVPLLAIHPRSVAASLAAQCAHEQGKFWEYHSTLFTTQDLTDTGLTQAALTHQLDISKWSTCQKESRVETLLNKDLKDATTLGVRGTPTFFVNGTRVEGVKTADEWRGIILDALQK